MEPPPAGFPKMVILPLLLLTIVWFAQSVVPCALRADDSPVVGYHTPLAGEPIRTVFMGKEIEIPRRDRSCLTALTLGGAYGTPKVGNIDALPIIDVFYRRYWLDSRTRDMVSIFVNDLEYDKGKGPLELVARFENDTLPLDRTEVINNREIRSSSLYWGTLIGSLGPGLRFPVPPYQVDNDFRVQLLGKVGYFYAKKTNKTGADVLPPPDTLLFGGKLRGRYDSLRRNLLELPFRGIATGFDLDFLHRDRWADFHTLGKTVFTRGHTRDYLQFTGYAAAATGVPGTSEKNTLFFTVHGGTTKVKSIDRFNAFRISGGPFPTETDDLYRVDYEGTMFNDLLAANYLLAAVEYRRELLFFMFLGLRASYISADLATITDAGEVSFQGRDGVATSLNLDSGFFWDSQIHLAYSWDFGFVRYGRPGSGIILTWSKAW